MHEFNTNSDSIMCTEYKPTVQCPGCKKIMIPPETEKFRCWNCQNVLINPFKTNKTDEIMKKLDNFSNDFNANMKATMKLLNEIKEKINDLKDLKDNQQR